MLSKSLLEQSLGDAFRAHFTKLFGVLLGEPDKQMAYQRFLIGFDRSVEAYERIEREIVDGWGDGE